MDLDPLYRRVASFYRGCGLAIGVVLIVLGLYLFVHDLLICFHVLPPDNPEGPYGVVVGPVMAMMGGGWLYWLRYIREISVNDD